MAPNPAAYSYNHLDLEKPLLDRTYDFPDRSDAKPNAALPHGKEGYSQVLHDDPQHRRWRGYIGTFIADNTGKDVTKQWHISDFPKGYTLWNKQRSLDNPRTDPYVFGYGGAKKFFSPVGFALHCLWLFDDDYHDNHPCQCTLCTGKMQGEVMVNWKGMPGRSVERSERHTETSASRTTVHDSGTGTPTFDIPPIARIARWTASRRLRIGEKSTLRPTSALSHERDLDLTSLRPYRVGEIVWVSISPMIPSRRPQNGPDEVIDFWPAIVQQADIGVITTPRGGTGEGYMVNHYRRYRVHMLGAGGNAVISESKILSWQAYTLPRVVFDQIKRPRMPVDIRVTEGLPELENFHPLELPSRTNRTPHNAASADGTLLVEDPIEIPRTFENALASLSLARRMVKIIEEHYCYTDLYRDPGESGGSRECYQGIWWGPERIWVDDLVRLNAKRQDLAKDGRNEFLRDPTKDAVGRATLAQITEFTWDTQKKQIYFSARLYELADEGTDPDLFGTDLRLRLPGCLSAPARSHSEPYGPPRPPDHYRFRRITTDGMEVYLPIQFIAGRYDPLPINSEVHRHLLQRVFNPALVEMLVTGRQMNPEAEANVFRVLAICGLCAAQEKNKIIATEWGRSRASVVQAAEAQAKKATYENWMKLQRKETKQNPAHDQIERGMNVDDDDTIVVD
ncbi:hypothetical protein FRB95_005122 [Tulasnella sp. JGI-2019a]|nr:hypothetical protein FRB95_005122 [Tulasnella sp. JGI-2019a]